MWEKDFNGYNIFNSLGYIGNNSIVSSTDLMSQIEKIIEQERINNINWSDDSTDDIKKDRLKYLLIRK